MVQRHPNFWDLARSSGVSKHPGNKPHSQKRKRSRKTHPLAESSSRVNMKVLTPTTSPSPKRSDLAKKKAISSPRQLSFVESLGSSSSQCTTIVNSDPYSSSFPWIPPPCYYGASPYYGATPYSSYETTQMFSNYCPPLSPFNTHTTYSSLQTIYHPSSKPSHPFTFKFITHRITKCQGCKGSLRIAGKLPTPPYCFT